MNLYKFYNKPNDLHGYNDPKILAELMDRMHRDDMGDEEQLVYHFIDDLDVSPASLQAIKTWISDNYYKAYYLPKKFMKNKELYQHIKQLGIDGGEDKYWMQDLHY